MLAEGIPAGSPAVGGEGMDASVVGGAVEEGFPDDTTSVVVFDLIHIKNTMHDRRNEGYSRTECQRVIDVFARVTRPQCGTARFIEGVGIRIWTIILYPTWKYH